MAYIEKVQNKKGITYRAIVRKKGFPPVSKTFEKKSDAKDWGQEVEAQMKNGTWSKTQERINNSIQTVKDLIDDFEKNIAPKRYSKPHQYKVMYDWWRNKIGNMNLADLNSNILTQCKNLLANEAPDKNYKEHKTKSNSTVRKYMFALSAVLRYGVRDLQLIDINPMANVEKPRKNKGVVRFLSEDERKRLIAACKKISDTLYLFVILAAFSGGRYSEIMNLTVENIDFENGMVYYVETKNGENRGVPIYHKLIDLIKEYLEKNDIKSGYVFINKNKNKPYYIKGALEKIIKDSNIENFRIHDLRHTYASYLAQNGAELLEIAQLMGHKNLQQVQIYAHLTIKHTAKIVRKMSANMWDFE